MLPWYCSIYLIVLQNDKPHILILITSGKFNLKVKACYFQLHETQQKKYAKKELILKTRNVPTHLNSNDLTVHFVISKVETNKTSIILLNIHSSLFFCLFIYLFIYLYIYFSYYSRFEL